MIEVRELIRKYSIEELNYHADRYYQDVNSPQLAQKPFRLPEMKHLLAEVSHLAYGLDLRPGDTVLDFGCGPGWTTRILSACGCRAIGVDVSKKGLNLAEQLAQRWNEIYSSPYGGTCEFRVFDGRRLPLDDNSVDKIFVLDAFHHVPDQASVLQEFARVLRPGGLAGFCEPGPNHSKHPDSQREMLQFTVIENDIVLADIHEVALQVGFSELAVCLSPLHPDIVSFEDYNSFPNNTATVARYVQLTNERVKNYPIFFLRRSGVPALDSRGIQGLSAELELVSSPHVNLRQGETLKIDLKIKNTGTAIWLPSGTIPGSVSIGGLLSDGSLESKPFRHHLSQHPVSPGQIIETTIIPIQTPSPGKFELTIDLVSEYIAWFKSLGGKELTIYVDVR